ncbi:MAG: MarR family transcriptional regulator [Acidimicrobiales bacterium]|nr:MarR family transcriptional regulator [Acidimicrobiales bacterium]
MQEPDPTSIFDTIEFRDSYRMSYLTNAVIVPTYEQIRKDFGIIRAEYHLLMCLAHYPILSAQEVSRLTRRPRNSISRAVHRMLDVGYLDRAPDPNDGRQALLTITPAGRRLHDKISARLADRQEQILAPLTAAERQQLDRILQKLSVHAAALPS